MLALAPAIGLLVIVVLAVSVGRQENGGMIATPAPALLTGPGTAGGAGAGTAGGAAVDGAAAPGVSAPDTAADPGAVAVGAVARQLVRTAQLSLDVDDPTVAGRKVRAAATGAGGVVAEEESTDSGSRLTLRVPADRLDATMDAVAGLGHVTSRASHTVDATEDVIDLDARVASHRASVDRVRALLAHATSIGDVLSVESELTSREADLDSLTGRLDALRGQVALSTLAVDVEKDAAPVPDGPGGFRAGLANGWEGLRSVGVGAGAVAGFLVPFLPVVAVLAGIAFGGRRIVRARRKPTAEQPGG